MFLWEQKVSRNSKSVSLLMHASSRISECKKKKSLFLSSGALSHFCLSDFCFLSVCIEDTEKEKNNNIFFFFVLAISELLNFIPPPFA